MGGILRIHKPGGQHVNEKKRRPIEVRVHRGPVEWVKAVFWAVLLIGLISLLFTSPEPSQPWEYLDEGLQRVRGDAPTIDQDTALVGFMELSGVILDEAMAPESVFDLQQYITPTRVRRELNAYGEREELDALVIHLTTPGGSVPASDALARLVQVFKTEKVPVYVYASSLMASGGYYMSAPATAIFSAPQAIVGSIGVIFQSVNVERLVEDKLGVQVRVFKQGRYKDMGSPFRPLAPEEEKLIQDKVDEAYQAFLGTIMANRDFTREELESVATGEVFTGNQARERKLVDDVLYLDQLTERLKAATGKQNLVYLSYRERTGLLQFLRGGRRGSPGQEILGALGPLSRFTLPSGTYYLMEQ
jgi:protease IV